MSQRPSNDSQPPLCKCGCGEYVAWNVARSRWNKYLTGHYAPFRGRQKVASEKPYQREDWLREQIEVKERTYQDIASEFGVSHQLINYYARTRHIQTRGSDWSRGKGQKPTCHPDRPHHGHGLCEDCYQKQWVNVIKAECHPDRPHVARGLCGACYQKEQAKRHHEEIKGRQRDKRKSIRQEMLDAYGHICACCGETHEEFLTLEHVNQDGNQHRAKVGNSHIYHDLKKRGWPKDGFAVLCYNCNIAKYRFGQCPHEKERQNQKADKVIKVRS